MNWIPKITYTEINTGLAKEFIFDSPPEGDPFNEEYKHKTTVTTSSNGTNQTQYNYGKKVYSLEFIFQSEITKEAVKDFFNNHAIRGGKFNYYPSSDEATYETFEIEGKGVSFKRPIPNGVGGFEYDFKIKMSRTI